MGYGGYGAPPPPALEWVVVVRYIGGDTLYRDFIGEYQDALLEWDRAKKRSDVAGVWILHREESIANHGKALTGKIYAVSPFVPEDT